MTELHVASSSWLRYEPADALRFGPVEAPTVALNTVDGDGCQWWCDEPEGWDAPEAVTPLDERQHGDGAYAGPTTFAQRVLQFGSGATGLCVAPDHGAARAAWSRLRSVVLSRRPVLYTAPDDGGPWSLWLSPSGRPRMRWIGPEAFEFAFVMVAEDPLKFDAAELAAAEEGNVTGLPRTFSGATFPIRGPIRFGNREGSGDGVLVIDNRGDEDAQALYRLTGPLDHPQVVNVTTGSHFTIGRAIDAGDTVEVDTRNATVYLNGVSIFPDLHGSFPLVVPGENTIRWSQQSGAYDPVPTLAVITASTRK